MFLLQKVKRVEPNRKTCSTTIALVFEGLEFNLSNYYFRIVSKQFFDQYLKCFRILYLVSVYFDLNLVILISFYSYL